MLAAGAGLPWLAARGSGGEVLGYGDFRIMFTQILPNTLGPIIVIATLGMGGTILAGFVDVEVAAILIMIVAVIGSVGAIAPFVGLFGTVWGIMNSFTGIAASGNTNLAAVAPGIAEALLATAIGLIAAIPAVLLYNHLARSAASLRALLADAVALVERTLSRELDRAALSESPPSSFPATMHHLHVAE